MGISMDLIGAFLWGCLLEVCQVQFWGVKSESYRHLHLGGNRSAWVNWGGGESVDEKSCSKLTSSLVGGEEKMVVVGASRGLQIAEVRTTLDNVVGVSLFGSVGSSFGDWEW